MNILDENVLESQRQRLIQWRIPIRQIGYELGRKGMADDDIIPLLLKLRQAILFTSDADFFKPELCHIRYGLVYLAVDELETAAFIRRFLRHSEFNTHAKRMGVVVRISHAGINVWRLHDEREAHLNWMD